MSNLSVVDITGSRDDFVSGFRPAAPWVEAYQPRDVAAYEATRDMFLRGSIREAMTSDDLPVLLGATIRTRLMQAYGMISQPWRAVVGIDNLPDLEQYTSAATIFSSDDQRGNAAPNNLIPEVPEGQGFDEARLGEVTEYAQLSTFGLVWSVTRRMLLADNLRAVNNMARDVGLAMKRTENWHFVNTLEAAASTTVSGKLLKDGTRMFAAAASRGNLHSGAYGLAADKLSAELIAFGAQTDRNGVTNTRNGIRAKYLIVPPDLEETAWNIVSPAARIAGTGAATTSDNYFKFLEVVVIPELSSSVDWYLAADPNMVPGVVAGFLNGRQEPEYFTQLANVNLAEADGTKQKIRHDFGFWVEQWHGWRKIDVTG